MESLIGMAEKLVTMRQLLYINLQELLNLQGVSKSPNTLFTMVHGHDFRIIT